MKTGLRAIALTLCFISGMLVSITPASARTTKHHHLHHHLHHVAKNERVRLSQIRLTHLGYFASRADGILGPATKSALKGFQSANNLPVNGKLTDETYNLLVELDEKQSQLVSQMQTTKVNQANQQFRNVRSESIALRSGSIDVTQEMKDGSYSYNISANGQPILHVDHQPDTLQISQAFSVNDEDALIITTVRGDEKCAYRNYIIIVGANGKPATKREFESCAASNEIREAFNALFIRFSGALNKNVYDAWDVWRYENGTLIRM